MSDDKNKEIGKRLKRARKAAGFSSAIDAATALGLNYRTYAGHENGNRGIGREALQLYTKRFHVSAEQLLTGNETQSDQSSQENAPANDVRPANIALPNRYSMPQDVPVMGTAACNAEHGAFKLDSSIIDYVRRPPGLAATKDVYALYVEGDSMEPKFVSGDLVFVHPRKPVRIGDPVVVQILKGESEQIEAMIAVLAKRTAQEVFLQKYNPNKIITVENKFIVAIHKILIMNELF